MKRGEIRTARIAFADGSAPKIRPMLVVQADYYNRRIDKVLLATTCLNIVVLANSPKNR